MWVDICNSSVDPIARSIIKSWISYRPIGIGRGGQKEVVAIDDKSEFTKRCIGIIIVVCSIPFRDRVSFDMRIYFYGILRNLFVGSFLRSVIGAGKKSKCKQKGWKRTEEISQGHYNSFFNSRRNSRTRLSEFTTSTVSTVSCLFSLSLSLAP